MAKLTGVKVIDMKDGEITKISYNGAEYEKVAHDFKDARTGDVFYQGGRGGFYEITISDNYFFGNNHPVRFVDDDGDDDGYMRGCDVHPLFRKISDVQSTPTLAEVSDKVDAIEKRVSALEGGDLKVGDYVIFTNGIAEHFVGKVSVIRELDLATSSKWIYGLNTPTGECDGWARVGDIRKATAEEIAEATAPKFEVGEYVKTLHRGEYFDIEAREIVKITVIDEDGWGTYHVKAEFLDGSDYDYFRPQDLEKLEGKDVERIVQFAKAGRKLNEFKKGDIAKVLDDEDYPELVGGIVEVCSEPYGSARGGNVDIKSGKIILADDLELIAPVESRVDVG